MIKRNDHKNRFSVKFQERLKRILSGLATFVMIVSGISPSLVAHADEPGYFITIDSASLTDNVLTIDGTGGFGLADSLFEGTSLGYYVKVSWGDGTYSYSNQGGGAVTDTFTTPDHGVTLAGSWSGTHTYPSEGTYDVTAELFYNPDQPTTPPVKDPTTNTIDNDKLKASDTTSVYVPRVNVEGYFITIDSTTVTDDTVDVDGVGGFELDGALFEGTSLGYYVKISWGDGTYSYSDAGSADATDAFTTPDHGVTLYGPWTGEHTYSSGGTYTIIAELFYNPNQPANGPVQDPTSHDLSNDIFKAYDTTDVTIEDNGGGGPSEGAATITILKEWVTDESETPSVTVRFGGDVLELGATYERDAGTYSISEDEVEGYESSVYCEKFYNDDESVDLIVNELGEVTLEENTDNVCTFTNTQISEEEQTGSLVIIKDVVNDDGGSAVIADFTFTVNNGEEDVKSGVESEQVLELPVGTYIITEQGPVGYEVFLPEYSGVNEQEEVENDCYFDEGDNIIVHVTEKGEAVCYITNDDIEGGLIVKKHVINDGEGTLGANEFYITLKTTRHVLVEPAVVCAAAVEVECEPHDAVYEDVVETTSFRGSESGVTFVLEPGTEYEVTESTFKAFTNTFNELVESEETHRYSISIGENCSGTYSEGVVECVITNDDPGSGGGSGGSGGDTGGGGATNPGSSGPVGGGGGGGPGGSVLGIEDIVLPTAEETAAVCRAEDPDAVIFTEGLNDLLAAFGFGRDENREGMVENSILPKIITGDEDPDNVDNVENFTVYGSLALLHLGAGERAGVLNSFRAVYKHFPRTECEWQNAIRIGKGLLPAVLMPDREAEVIPTFEAIYGHAPDASVDADHVTHMIMAYGLRPNPRSLDAERQAIVVFHDIFGHVPGNVDEWDAMRAIAYGPLVVPGHSPIVR